VTKSPLIPLFQSGKLVREKPLALSPSPARGEGKEEEGIKESLI